MNCSETAQLPLVNSGLHASPIDGDDLHISQFIMPNVQTLLPDYQYKFKYC